MRHSGKEDQALIRDLCVQKRGKGTNHYIIFLNDAVQYEEVAQHITRKSYRRLQKHKFVTITYLPNSPQVARLSGDDVDAWSRGIYTILALVFVGLVPPLLILWIVIAAGVYLIPAISVHPFFRRIGGWRCDQTKQKHNGTKA